MSHINIPKGKEVTVCFPFPLDWNIFMDVQAGVVTADPEMKPFIELNSNLSTLCHLLLYC
jgi:hypothetical protein